jgi:hypothetical protein
MDPLRFDAERVRDNVRQATTEDLLDRCTVYAEGMEPEALEIIECELRDRGISADAIEVHRQARQEAALHAGGEVVRCSLCPRPAVARGWGWRRLFGVVPLFPQPAYFCERHRPGGPATTSASPPDSRPPD